MQKTGLSRERFFWSSGTPLKNLERLLEELGASATARAWWLKDLLIMSSEAPDSARNCLHALTDC